MKILCYVVTYRFGLGNEKRIWSRLIEIRTGRAATHYDHLFTLVVFGLRIMARMDNCAF
jgi:hypothetical protein